MGQVRSGDEIDYEMWASSLSHTICRGAIKKIVENHKKASAAPLAEAFDIHSQPITA
jgi:hypothetical protein